MDCGLSGTKPFLGARYALAPNADKASAGRIFPSSALPMIVMLAMTGQNIIENTLSNRALVTYKLYVCICICICIHVHQYKSL